jgi:putative SOS response-associated peptidase YedK
MAGLYEIWRNKEIEDPDADDAWLWTCTVLTTSSTDELGRIHDRMPLLVEKERYDAWLDPRVSDTDTLLGLLVPAAPGRLEAYPVSRAVNSVKNNGPHLMERVPEGAVDADGVITDPSGSTLF